ncbi:hypothetical protein [Pseudomonas oligotrophica]|uniref:hypothetical protein n=1 Tax=Pseudomonas oligotrophica TaxID=2912055 RepID=UPI001F47369A|nr:hypothetical protein [Pseudomonas oligotrophica]MCF7203502.1 hypothetical protein [Pseudomonas oligotrophica]
MSRLPILLVALSLLGGCTVYGHGDHDYHRPYYYGGYEGHRHSSYPTRYYYYDRPDYRRPAPVVRYYDDHHDRRYQDRHEQRYEGDDKRHYDNRQTQPPRQYSRGPEHKAQGHSERQRALHKARPQGKSPDYQRGWQRPY